MIVGWPVILADLARHNAQARKQSRDHFLLFGSYHDSSGQIAAFRRVVGPAALGRLLSHLVVEQLDADGRWGGVPATEQQGDSRWLRRWIRHGHRPSLDTLAQRQARGNYTAWKYGYLDELSALLIAARAGDRPLLGCDMPGPLQRRIADLPEDLRDRLRELHCLLALDDVRRGRVDVAMLWGQSHLLPGGLPRFLPAKVAVTKVQLFGFRPGQSTLEQSIAARGLVLFAPALIPACEAAADRCGSLLLLLDGPTLGGEVDRARDPVHAALAADGRCKLQIRSTRPGTLDIASRRVEIPRRGERTLDLDRSGGGAGFRFRSGDRVLIGRVELPSGGGVELELDPPRRAVTVVYHPLIKK